TGNAAPLAVLKREGSTEFQDHLGEAGFFLGDVDSDGVLDVVFGASPINVEGERDAGLTVIWSGASLGSNSGPSAVLVDTTPVAGTRATPRLLADITGDGTLDVLALSPDYDGTVGFSGAVLLWEGGSLSGTVTPTSVLVDREDDSP
ncbi:MAG: hypothetical protein AAF658_08615, partial [Myxococcota bacterium]